MVREEMTIRPTQLYKLVQWKSTDLLILLRSQQVLEVDEEVDWEGAAGEVVAGKQGEV